MPKKMLEKIAAAPAVALEDTVAELSKLEKLIISKRPLRHAEDYWATLGPGLTTGASDDDPSGIATYSQAGSQFGFKFLWLAPYTFPLMAAIQEMCARIGLVTGQGLAANIRTHYAKWVLYLAAGLLFCANTFNIGADLGALAQATRLLAPELSVPFLVIGFALLSLLLQIFTTYARYAKYLKYLSLVLFAYVFSAMYSHLNWGVVLQNTFWPDFRLHWSEFLLICGVLGTTISPYLFFWQSSQEVEEEIQKGRLSIKKRQLAATKSVIKKMRIDVWTGMAFSNMAMFFIIAACAGTLFAHGITNIATAADAAAALRPIAGDMAYLLFAVGIIGVGILAIPVLAGSASYAIAESFGWKFGLYRKLKQAYAFYGIIILSMLVGLLLNFVGLDPIKALIYAAVANGLVAPVILILIVRLSSNPKVMGKHINGRLSKTIGWLTVGLMVAAGAGAIIALFL